MKVRFDLYCDKCKYAKLCYLEEPCNTCMEQRWNEGTDRPTQYKEKTK